MLSIIICLFKSHQWEDRRGIIQTGARRFSWMRFDWCKRCNRIKNVRRPPEITREQLMKAMQSYRE